MTVSRYHRQMLLPVIGEAGQDRLRSAHVIVVGCGALGTVIADALARAGIGTLTIVDRDIVELTNLQRQVLFDESHVEQGTPKAIAARDAIHRINSDVEVRAFVEDFNHSNIDRLAEGADLLLDGLDNFQTRYLLNDYAVNRGLPYLYGGAVGTTGMATVFLPYSAARSRPVGNPLITWTDDHASPCLRCVFPEAPPPGASPTCDTAGVLGSTVSMIAHHQVVQAIKLIVGDVASVDHSLLSIDVWHNQHLSLDISGARSSGHCTCCVSGQFEFLEGRAGSAATSLCGRGAVQINPSVNETEGRTGVSLHALGDKLAAHGRFVVNSHLIRGTLEAEMGDADAPIELTVFADGRAIVAGTGRLELARSIYDKYIGA